MALTNLSFVKTGDAYVSAAYAPSTSNMAVGVKFAAKPGSSSVERSINGGMDWVVAGMVASAANSSGYVVMNVCGFVVGEIFRVTATEEPASIDILEGD
jgi:hypothetical protein